MRELDDSELLELIHSGNISLFSELYRRNLAVARYVARAESENPGDVDDVVAEAFASVFSSLASGKGPREAFRPYLTTAVRRMAHRRNIQGRRSPTLGVGSSMDALVLDDDTSIKAFEATILMRAFRSLPERWQVVLWCVEVEGMRPAATGLVMDLTANGVSALLIRAREGLRQAYLQQHVSDSPGDPCTDFSRHLGKFVRNAIRKAARMRVKQHVSACQRCADVLRELTEIHAGMTVPSHREVVGGEPG